MQKYLYKYRAIQDQNNLDDDKTLSCLFEHKAVFSSRKYLNDLFDSKIHFNGVSENDIRRVIELGYTLRENSPKEQIKEIDFMFADSLNKLLDSYVFYSVSANPKSNLMWSHYADSHRGFCIEFKKEMLNATPINYSATIAELDLMYCMDVTKNGVNIGQAIQKSLLVKLNEWKYEREYRFFPSNELRDRHLINNGSNSLIPYEPEWVESIIFGCRMKNDIQEHIISKYQSRTKFKKAVERKDYIDIIDL